MSILSKRLTKFYFDISNKAVVDETHGDIAFIRGITNEGWFDAVESTSLVADGEDIIAASEQNMFWVRQGTGGAVTPSITDLVPVTYAEGVVVKDKELVLVGSALYLSTEAHTATADNVTNLDKVTSVGSGATSLVPNTYVAGTEVKANELVVVAGVLYTSNELHTPTAANVTNLDKVTKVDSTLERIIPHVYVDGDDLSAGEVFTYAGSLYFSGNPVNGALPTSDTWTKIKDDMILIGEVAVAPTPVFDPLANYVANDVVRFDGFDWTCKAGGHSAGAFDVANWTRSAGPVARGAFSATSVYLTGDSVDKDGYSFTAKSDMNAGAFDGTKWTRKTTKFFSALPVSEEVIVGDRVLSGSVYLYCQTTYMAGATDTLADVLANFLVLSDESKATIRSYATDQAFVAGEVIEHDGGFFYVETAFDGTTTATTFQGILANLVTIKAIEVAPLPFVAADTYNENDLVEFDGQLFTRNATARTGGDAFSLTHFDFVRTEAMDRGVFNDASVYLTDDTTIFGGVFYQADQDLDPAAFDETKFTRLSAKVFDEIPAGAQTFLVGDIVPENNKLYICIAELTTTATLVPVNQATEFKLIVNAENLIPRTYSDGDDVEQGEIIQYGGNLYYSPNSVNGASAGTDTWTEIEASMILVAQVPVTPTDPFDPLVNYAENDEVIFDGYKWACKAGGHAAGAFDVANWTRFVAGGEERGAFSATSVYLTDDIVVSGEYSYKALSDLNAAAFSAASFTRITSGFFTSLDNSTEYIIGDELLVEDKYFRVHTTFTTDADALLTEVEANLHLLADNSDAITREYADGDSFVKGELLRTADSLYLVKEDFDGTDTNLDTFAEIEDKLILLAKDEVVAVPFVAADTYNENDLVEFDGQLFTRNATARTGGDAFSLTHFDFVRTEAMYRGVFSDASVYLAGDEVKEGALSYLATSNLEPATFDAANFDRITTTVMTEEPVTDTQFIVGDVLHADNETYVCTTAFKTTGALDLVTDGVNFVLVDDGEFVKPRLYVDGDSLEAGQVFTYDSALYYAPAAVDGTDGAFDTWAEVEPEVILLAKPAEEPIPAHDPASTYVTGDKVVYNKRVWEATKDITVAEAFTVGSWMSTGDPVEHASFDPALAYGSGDRVVNLDITYEAKADTDPQAWDADNFTRIDSLNHSSVTSDYEYIADDRIRDGDKLYLVETSFTIDSGASETIDDHLSSLYLLSDDGRSKLVVYTDGMSLEAQTLFIYGSNVYYTPSAIDGSLTQSDTWAEIETQVNLVGELGTVFPAFNNTLGYNENDVVNYKGFLFTRNAAVRTPPAPLSLTEFDRVEPAGFDHGEFVADIPYLTGDLVTVDGVTYKAFSNSDNIASFSEGSAAGKFERVTPKEFTAYPATATRFIKGDKLYLTKRSFFVTADFTTTDGDSIDAHIGNLAEISNDLENITREYANGDSFKKGEFLTYNQNLYYVDTAWVANTTPGSEADHEWAAVETKCTLISSVGAVAPVAFDKTATYTEGTVIIFDGLLYTRNAASRPASSEFSLTHFNRNQAGGLRRGPISTSAAYIAGDIVTVGGKDYRMNSNVDYNVDDDTVLSEAPSGQDTYIRVNEEVFTAVEDGKVYIAKDVILDGKKTYYVTGSFISATPADLEAQANAVLISNDEDNIAPAFSETETYDAGSLFQDSQVLYFVYEEITVAGPIGDHSDKIMAVSKRPSAAPVNFDPAIAYTDGDRVNFQGFIWTRNTNPRSANDPFSITQFDREPVDTDHVDRGEFAAGNHLIAGDEFTFNGIGYTANVDKDVTTDTLEDAWAAYVGSATRIGNMSFTELVATTDYVKNDLFRIDRRTYITQANFTTTTDLEPETYAELILLTEDDRSVTKSYEAGDTIESGEMIRYQGVLYIAPAKVDGSVDTNWVMVLPKLTEVVSLPASVFNPLNTYDQGDKVIYLGLVYLRNANPRNGGDIFSIDDFDRVEPAGYDHGAFDSNKIYLTGDIFESAGNTYEMTANKAEGDDLATTLASAKRVSPVVQSGIANDFDYIVGDRIDFANYSFIINTAFTSSAAADEDEVVANADVVDIKDTYYLAADDAIVYHDHQKKGHEFIVEADYTVAEMNAMLEKGDRLILRSDKTSTDTPALADFDLYKVGQAVEPAAVPFVAADVYATGDKVVYKGYEYVKNAVARTGGTAFSITHFDRVIPGGEEMGTFDSTHVYLIGDTFELGPNTYLAEANKDAGVDYATFQPDVKRINTLVFTTLTPNRSYIVGDRVEFDHYDLLIHTDFTSDADPIETEIAANADVVNLKEVYYLAADTVIAYHDFQKKGHEFVVEADYTAAELGVMLEKGDRLILRADKVSTDTPVLADFDLYKVDQAVEPAAVTFVQADTYAEGDKVIYEGYEFVKNVTPRTGGTEFSIAHFDRVIPGGEAMGEITDSMLLLVGDTFTGGGLEYRALIFKDATTDIATYTATPNSMVRLTPTVFTTVGNETDYIEGDRFDLAYFSVVLNQDLTTSNPGTEAEVIAAGEVVDIQEVYYLAADDAVTYHDFQKKGHEFVVEADYTAELFAGFTPKKGTRLILNADYTSTDTAELSHFDVFVADEFTVVATAPVFDPTLTYTEGDRVTYEGMVYLRNATVRAMNDPFSIVHFDREDTSSQEFRVSEEADVVKLVALAGDVIYYRDDRFSVLADKDAGAKDIYDKTKFTRLGVSTLYATAEDYGKTDMLPGDIIIHNGNTYFTRYAYEKPAAFTWDLFFNNAARLRNFIVLGTALISDYTIEGRVKLGTEPGSVVAPGGDIPFRDRTVVDWDAVFAGITLSAIVEASLNGVDITSEIEADVANNVFKLKADSTLEIFADDILVFHFDA
jgi:chitodextrinase